MAQTVCVIVGALDRERLQAIVSDRNRPRKHLERACIVLASADRRPAQQVAQSIGVSRPTVWRWQQRSAEAGVEGLLRDQTRKPGKAPIAADKAAQVVALTCTAPPHQATHWTGRAMAKTMGLSLRSVQRIWQAHQLQPHRRRRFKRSRDPAFAAKLADIVGLYIDPPAHAVVLSLDEKSQIQALDRTQPGLPLKPGRCQTMTHDDKRHSTTTLFAALSVLDGTVIGRCMQRHRHSEFIRFLNAIERQVPAEKPIHAVLDNYATHKHPKSLPSRRRGCWLGSRAIHAGRSTSPRPPPRGSMRSKTSFPRSPVNASAAASSARLSSARPPSTLIWPSTMPIRNLSSGPNPPMLSSPNSSAFLYYLNASEH
jgi:transposase